MNRKLVLVIAVAIALTGLVGFGVAIDSSGDTVESDETDDEVLESGEDVIEQVYESDGVDTLQATVVTEYDSDGAFGDDEPMVEEIWLDGDQLRTDRYDGDELVTVEVTDGDEQLVHYVDDNEYSERTTAFNATERHAEPLPEDDLDDIEYEVELVGEERHDGHDTYHIQIEITDEDELEGVDEATIDLWIEDEHWFPVTTTVTVSYDETDDDAMFDGGEFETTVTYENLTLDEPIADDRFEYELPDDAEERSFDSSLEEYDSVDELNDAVEFDVTAPETLGEYEFHEGSVHTFEDNDTAHATYGDDRDVTLGISEQHHEYVDEDAETVTVNDREATVVTHSFGDTEHTTLRMECHDETVTIGGELTEDEVVELAEEIEC